MRNSYQSRKADAEMYKTGRNKWHKLFLEEKTKVEKSQKQLEKLKEYTIHHKSCETVRYAGYMGKEPLECDCGLDELKKDGKS